MSQQYDALSKEVADLKVEVADLKASIDALVTAWKMAGHMVSAVKWSAGFVAAIAAAWAAIIKIRAGGS